MGAICKALHVLPREGGVLDQRAEEVIYIEAMLDAFNNYEDYLSKKSNARDKNRARHTVNQLETTEA